MNAFGGGYQFLFILLQRQHRDFDRCNGWMQAQHRTRLFPIGIRFLFIGIKQYVEEGAVNPTGGLNDPGDVALFGLRVGIAQIMTAILAMTREIPILAPVNTFPLLPTKNGLVLDVESLLGIVSEFIAAMRAQV